MSPSRLARHVPVVLATLATAAMLSAPTPPADAVADRPVLSRANLPTSADLAFHRPGDWRTRTTRSTLGVDPISDCLSGRNLEVLDFSTLHRRDFTLRGDRAQPAVALNLEFGTTRLAERAHQRLRGWFDTCPERLRTLGYARASVDPWRAIDAGSAADFTVVAHASFDQPDAEAGVFEEIGLVRTGRRLALVSMSTIGQDYTFSTRDGDHVSTYPSIRSLPAVAERLAADRTGARVLRDDQLLGADEVPALGRPVAIAAPGRGRPVDAATVCTDGVGLTELKATQARGRAFVTAGRPRVLTVALQFPSRKAAKAAARTFVERIDTCPKALRESGHDVEQRGVDWLAAPTRMGTGRFTEIVHQRPEAIGSRTRTFESVGLTRVGDRVMITVYVVHGQDFNVSYRPGGDPATELPAHPQFGLIRAAADRLGR